MGKEEIARNEQFLLFPQCFLLIQKIVYPFVNIFDIIYFSASELKEPKIGLSGKGLYTGICEKGLFLYSKGMFHERLSCVPRSIALTLYQTTKKLDWSKLKACADDKLNVT